MGHANDGYLRRQFGPIPDHYYLHFYTFNSFFLINQQCFCDL